MKKITLFIFSFVALSVYAQNVDWALSDTGVSDYNAGKRVNVDAEGSVYVAGAFAGYYHSNNPDGSFLSKYDSSGNLIWSKIIYATLLKDAFTDKQGNSYLTGAAYGTVDFGGNIQYGTARAFLAKYDKNGNCLWVKTSSYCNPKALVVDHADNIYITGTGSSYDWSFGGNCLVTSSSTLYTLKFDSQGNCQWATQADGIGMAQAITLDKNENPIIAGTILTQLKFYSGTDSVILNRTQMVFTASYNAVSGQLIYARGIADSMFIFNPYIPIIITCDKNNNIYLSGSFYEWATINGVAMYSGQYNNLTMYDYFIVKLDSTGNFSFVRQLGTNICKGEKSVTGIHLSDNGYYLTGILGASYSFGFTNDSNNVYLAEFDDNTGSPLWAKNYSGSNFSYGIGLAYPNGFVFDNSKNIYVTGKFTGPLTFDSFNISQTDEYYDDMFLIKINGLTNSATGESLLFERELNIYPNPSTGIFTIQMRNCQVGAKVTVRNVLGNCLLEKNCRGETSQEINLSCQPRGIYFVELLSGDDRVVKKVVVQ